MKDPVAGKLGVRKAIAYLLDRDALVSEVYQDTATPLYSIVPAGITGHNTAFFDTYGARPPRPGRGGPARRRHHRQGEAHPVVHPEPLRPRHRRRVPGDRQTAQRQRTVRGEGQVPALRAVREGIAAGKFGVYVKGWVPDYPDPTTSPRPSSARTTSCGNNYSNDTITGRSSPSTAAQTDRSATDADFGELQDIVAKDVPILPVWQGKQYAVARENVSGLEDAWTPRPSSASGRSARAEPELPHTNEGAPSIPGRGALAVVRAEYCAPGRTSPLSYAYTAA